jgi:hypothetical protein
MLKSEKFSQRSCKQNPRAVIAYPNNRLRAAATSLWLAPPILK